MIKRTQHSLKFITAKKRQLLDSLFVEYQRVVNEFIVLYWDEKKLPSKANASQWRQVTTWLCGKAVKCAYRQAIQMIKSAQAKNKKRIYRSYQRVYAYAKGRRKNWTIVNQKWLEWSDGRKFRSRVNRPIFNGNSIDLNSDLATVYTSPKKMKNFDLAVRLGSIFGNRISLLLPTKKHALFNKHILNGYSVNSSVQLRRIDGKLYVNLFLEKETPKVKDTGKVLGIDVGIKKLMSTSDGEFFGRDIEVKIQKLKRRKRDSKNFKQTLAEIKDYIGQQVNKLKLEDVGVVVVEDLDVKNMCRKRKSSKEHRKTLGNWNSRLLFGRLSNRCEENRVFLSSVESEYTSQICSSCGITCKESRKGERYECESCGASKDADHNAGMNIRNRFLSRELTVPREQQQVSLGNFT
jgi:IS605 OrfB family transposase